MKEIADELRRMKEEKSVEEMQRKCLSNELKSVREEYELVSYQNKMVC